MKRMKMKTTSGMTMVDLDKICAYTVNKMDKQFLTNQGFVIDIHMDNGTIFTASFSEAEKVIFENKWEGTE